MSLRGNLITRGPVAARWQDGKSAAAHETRLFYPVHSRELRICDAQSDNCLRALSVWPLDAVRLAAGTLDERNAALRLGLEPDNGERLIIEPGPGRDEAASWLEPQVLARKKSGLRRWAGVFLAAWAVGIALYLFAPVIFSLAAGLIPRGLEEKLGRSAREQVVGVLTVLPGVRGIDERAGASPELKALVERLEKGASVDGYVFDIQVLDADFVNAFALPGGAMLVTSALIRDCESPDELAGVLAHEMAHVIKRHGTAAVIRQQAWSVMARMLGATDNLAGSLATALLDSSFSRDQEREADMLGAARLLSADVNPLGLAAFFERLEKQSPDKGQGFGRYISSHPLTAERKERIRTALESGELRQIQGSGPAEKPEPERDFSPALDDAAWQRLRALTARPDPAHDSDLAI